MTLMTAILLFAILAATLGATANKLRVHLNVPRPASRPPAARRQAAAPAKLRPDPVPTPVPGKSAPDLTMLEWNDSGPAKGPVPIAGLQARIRDRYIAARFPGVHGSAQLQDVDQVIGLARHYFEEEKFDRAQELLDIAIQQATLTKRLRLAQIEIAYLARDAALFTRLARDFRGEQPFSAEWDDVARLGRAIAPGEELFGASPDERVHEHYGAWPEMPNWIEAPWDLTSEVLGADFHRAITAHAEQQSPPALRHAA